MTSRRDVHLVSKVLWLRHAQLAINERLQAREFKIPVHLALGHEAVAVAVTEHMTRADRLLLSHRNLHYNLGRVGKVLPIIREFRGEGDAIARGTLGSMNLSQPEAGLIYTSNILGNNLPVAAGVAMALKSQGEGGVAFVVTGDGAMEEGAFYETFLLAGCAQVPLVILVENNGWSMYTEIAERRNEIDLAGYAESLGAGYIHSDGVNVVKVLDGVKRARDFAKLRSRPCVLEVSLSTLGDIMQEGRLINYHHGPAPEVSWSKWPILDQSGKDPVAKLVEQFSGIDMEEISLSAFEAVRRELV